MCLGMYYLGCGPDPFPTAPLPGQLLFFVYDGTSPTAVVYNGTTYYYQTNLQGDIIAILNGSGTKVVEYTYDAWGNILSTTGTLANTLGVLNPLRYRGYVYDTETGLYYLQSRYYNPAWGRFLNADAFTSTGQGFTGNNMFAYCGNNPVLYVDPSGFRPAKPTLRIPEPINKKRKKCFPDLTEELNQAMREHAEELREYRKTNGLLAATLYFMNKVKDEGEWDLKSDPEWKLVEGQLYMYDGQVLSFDDPGNIHYGYVGYELFSEDILLLAAGGYQIISGTSSWTYWDTNFDQPWDQEAISYGYNLREGKKNG